MNNNQIPERVGARQLAEATQRVELQKLGLAAPSTRERQLVGAMATQIAADEQPAEQVTVLTELSDVADLLWQQVAAGAIADSAQNTV